MQDCKEHDIHVVTTTVGTEADARRLARTVVDDRLAACVQVEGPITSVFWWKGQLDEAAEWRLTIKTHAERLPDLQELFSREHPYEMPQFVALPARASAGYAGWVRDETLGPGAPPP